jgi:D-amino-acid dehydrogenase
LKSHLIIGCGVIGLTTALELLRRGEQVTLIDAADHEGLGTSFANGGMLTPSMSDPWNSPGVHRHLLEYLVSSSSALKLRLGALPSLAFWGAKFLLNSRSAPYERATIANLELSTYSLSVLAELRRDHGLSYEQADRGTLKIFRSTEALETALGMSRMLERYGLVANALEPHEIVQIEPCLAPISQSLSGAIFYPGDAAGDAHLFCRAMTRTITDLGGVFHFGRRVRSIEADDGRVTGIHFEDGFLPASSVIVATGVTSPALTAKLGAKLAIKPVKGYSVTYDAREAGPMPRLPVIDDAYHACVTPLGSRLRVAGTAEFAGHNVRLDTKRVDNLTRLFKAIYPQAANDRTLATGKPWAGLRPVSADGRPYIGPAATRGLWINSGHGHLGWTLAAGSARLLVDLMASVKPALDPSQFAVAR